MGYKKKIVVSGTLRFSDELDYSKNSKVKVIGITTSGRFCTSGIEKEINIPKFLHTRRRVPINFLKTEVELLDTLSLLFKHFSKSNYKFLLKPHPFESVGIYERAFPGIKIDDSKDIRTFLSKIDVLLNHESSANFHALRYKIPVISLRKMVNSHPGFKKSLSEYAPYLIGIPVKNFYELEKILNNKQNILFKKNINNKDLKLIEKTAPLLNSPKIIASELLKHKKEFTNINAIAYIKFLLKEIYLYSVIKRKTLFHPFNLSDKKLLKSFRVHRGKNLRKGK